MDYSSLMVRFENIEHKLNQLYNKIENIESKLDKIHFIPELNIIVSSDVHSIQLYRLYEYSATTNYEYSIIGEKEISFEEYDPTNYLHYQNRITNKYYKKIKNLNIYMNNANISAKSLQLLPELESISLETDTLLRNLTDLANIPTLIHFSIKNRSRYNIEEIKQIIPQLKKIQIGSNIQQF